MNSNSPIKRPHPRRWILLALMFQLALSACGGGGGGDDGGTGIDSDGDGLTDSEEKIRLANQFR